MRPLELRNRLYRSVMRHRAAGKSYNQIIRDVEGEFHVRLSKSHVSHWTRGVHVPDGSVTKFVPVPTAELGYVVGVMLGDGNAGAVGDHNYKLRLRVTDKDFAEAFAEAIGSVLSKPSPRVKFHAKTHAWHVEVSSLLLYQFLTQPLKQLRPTIGHCDDCSGGFLRGFFDSEGNVSEGSITATNTDKALIQEVLSQLWRLGIQTTGPHLKYRGGHSVVIKGKTCRANHDCFGIRIRNLSRRRFLDKVGFRIKRKRDALASVFP